MSDRKAFEAWLTGGGGWLKDYTSEDYLKRIRRKDGSYSPSEVNGK